MAYEVFKRTRVRVEEPTVAITPRGTIVFNAAASRMMTIAGIKAVLLLWDKSGNRKSFLSYIGWHADKRESLPATWDEKEKMIEITLPSEFISGAVVLEVGKSVLGVGKRRIRLE
jgi:hypothetical protein